MYYSGSYIRRSDHASLNLYYLGLHSAVCVTKATGVSKDFLAFIERRSLRSTDGYSGMRFQLSDDVPQSKPENHSTGVKNVAVLVLGRHEPQKLKLTDK